MVSCLFSACMVARVRMGVGVRGACVRQGNATSTFLRLNLLKLYTVDQVFSSLFLTWHCQSTLFMSAIYPSIGCFLSVQFRQWWRIRGWMHSTHSRPMSKGHALSSRRRQTQQYKVQAKKHLGYKHLFVLTSSCVFVSCYLSPTTYDICSVGCIIDDPEDL
jgi:hypothetical protein